MTVARIVELVFHDAECIGALTDAIDQTLTDLGIPVCLTVTGSRDVAERLQQAGWGFRKKSIGARWFIEEAKFVPMTSGSPGAPGTTAATSGLKTNMTPPTVVISLDLELCWGSFDQAYGDDLVKMARWTHDVGVPILLSHLTRNRLAASWAIVGGMMRSSLPDVSAFPEVRYSHFPKPWFEHVPKNGNESAHREWSDRRW